MKRVSLSYSSRVPFSCQEKLLQQCAPEVSAARKAGKVTKSQEKACPAKPTATAKECGLFGETFSSKPDYTLEPAGNTGKTRTKRMRARLDKSRIKGGQEPTATPPGFPTGVNVPFGPVKVARGHILAKELGGKANAANIRNLVPICQQTTNISMRDYAEDVAKEIIDKGYTVDYEVTLTYWTKNPFIPKTITIKAKGWKCGVGKCWKLKTVELKQIFDLSKCPERRP